MTYHTGYFRHDLLIVMWHCVTIIPFFFPRGGGEDWCEPQPVSVLDTLAKCEPT